MAGDPRHCCVDIIHVPHDCLCGLKKWLWNFRMKSISRDALLHQLEMWGPQARLNNREIQSK